MPSASTNKANDIRKLYEQALKKMNDERAEKINSGISVYTFDTSTALFQMFISPSGAVMIKEYTPTKLTAGLRVHPKDDGGLDITMRLSSIVGEADLLPKYIDYLTAVNSCVNEMQKVVNERLSHINVKGNEVNE